MSKVKIVGNASGSGTLTLTGPDTNSDRTITIPDETGTIALGVGIDDNADATAITIDSSENVGIGTGSPTSPLHILASSAGQTIAKFESNQAGSVKVAIDTDADRDSHLEFQEAGTTRWDLYSQGSSGGNELNIRNQSGTNIVQFTQAGLGLSQFTAKGWIQMSGTGTISITDSYNVSGINDDGTGNYTISWDVNLANGNYACIANCPPNNNEGAYGGVNARAVGTCAIDFRKATNDTSRDVDNISVIAFGD